ncbi:MAG: bifunctional diguanylate cyclase/phosphodiesterase [Marinobacter sp.]|uniref:bifunctional diguanylate cyclase/phosphodiesterase n=1 Tax=Marinobacter sp. TaxID=50741 RepID=UPI003C3CC306
MARMQSHTLPFRQKGVISLRSLLLLYTGSLVLLLLLASLAFSFDRFRDYVSDQLAGHARDGATAVGLSLSNAIDGRDPVASASLIDSVFDSGRYLSVVYLDHQGQQVAGRETVVTAGDVPAWFVSLADLSLPVGRAEVVRGWSRLGSVEVISHPGRAYHDLWRVAVGMIVGTLFIGGLGLAVLFWIVRRTLQPLKAMEKQAEALGRRDFRKRIEVNSTRDLNQVTRAMNQMADDLGALFEGQAKLIQHLRRVNNEDPVTGLASRSAFDQRLKVEVESEERAAPGVLFLIQLEGFSVYNQTYGRSEADRLLLRIAGAITVFVRAHTDAFAGRRTGAEFALFLPGVTQADGIVWCQQLVEELDGIYSDLAAPVEVMVHGGVAQALGDRNARELMAAADEALRQAQAGPHTGCHAADPDRDGHHNRETWRAIITEAIRDDRVSLWLQPMVLDGGGALVYHQVFSRITSDEGELKASVFVPMAERFGLIEDIDRRVSREALELLRRRPGGHLALTLSASSVASDAFRSDLLQRLEAAADVRERLWIGISEQTVHHHRTAVGLLVRALNRLHVAVLVDRFGVGGVPFSYLRNLRFQGLRIDNSFIHDIDTHQENRFYLESVVAIAHSRGVKVFATGVETAAEHDVLRKLGVDGAMGYHLGRPFKADNENGQGDQ